MKKDDTLFNELQTSLKQAAAIRKGKMQSSRVFTIAMVSVKATHAERAVSGALKTLSGSSSDSMSRSTV